MCSCGSDKERLFFLGSSGSQPEGLDTEKGQKMIGRKDQLKRDTKILCSKAIEKQFTLVPRSASQAPEVHAAAFNASSGMLILQPT